MRRHHAVLLLLVALLLSGSLLWMAWPSGPTSPRSVEIEPARSLEERQAERRRRAPTPLVRNQRSPSAADIERVQGDEWASDTGSDGTWLVLDVTDAEGGLPARAYAIVRCEPEWRAVLPLLEGSGEVQIPSDATCEVRAVRQDGLLSTQTDWQSFSGPPGDDVDVAITLPVERKGGIGIHIAESPDGILAMAVYPGTPAWEAGLREGDVIVQVGDLPASTLTIREFQEVMTGPEGTEVEFLLAPHADDTGMQEQRVTATRSFLDPSLLL